MVYSRLIMELPTYEVSRVRTLIINSKLNDRDVGYEKYYLETK